MFRASRAGSTSPAWRRLIGEPFLHFLLLGAALFAVYGWLNREADGTSADRPEVVRIGAGEVRWLVETWSRQWQRDPTREELRGLVTDYLREQLLAREARAIGLDENDTIVRRRLAQKLEFLIQDTLRLAEPTDADLRRFHAAHPALFRNPARVSFTHVYFNSERRADAAADARAALPGLRRGTAAPEEKGDRLLLEPVFDEAVEQTVRNLFGHGFLDALLTLPPGEWSGPIESAYGIHLVRVSKIRHAEPMEFAAVREQVRERWSEEREREAVARYFAELMKKYDVEIEEEVKELVGPLAQAEVGEEAGS